jgi:hypothetical protein
LHENLKKAIVSCCEDIVNTYETHEYLPTYLQVLLCGDPSFTFRDQLLYFKYRPGLRKKLIVSFLIRPFFLWQRLTDRNLSRKLKLTSPMCSSFHTFFNDIFILEALLTILSDMPDLVSDDLYNRIYRTSASILQKMIGNLETFHTDAGDVEIINFFPPNDLRMDPSSLFYRQVSSWKIDPDTDCTYGNLVAFDYFLKLTEANPGGRIKEIPYELVERIKGVVNNPAFLDLILEFQALPGSRHKARITINGLDPENGGIMTWIGTRENDVDPTVNINVLTSVLRNRTRWNLFERQDFLKSLQHTLNMLVGLVRTGMHEKDRTFLYYLPIVFCVKFARFYHEYDQLSAAEKKAFDPNGLVDEMRDQIEKTLLKYAASKRLSKLDYVYIAGALMEINYHGDALASLIAHMGPEPHIGKRDKLTHQYQSYEFFKGKPPFKFIYGSEVTSAGFALRTMIRMAESIKAGTLCSEAVAACSEL